MSHIYISILILIKIIVAQDYDYEKRAIAKTQTPVPILKQINRHNEDGSYTYGYEGADGSFKIETKSKLGEVKGKYGYVDQTGKLRVVEYGANKYGFQPSGEGITVAPPTLVDETTSKDGTEIENEHNYHTNGQTKVFYRNQPQLPPQPQSQVPVPYVYQQHYPTNSEQDFHLASKPYEIEPEQLAPQLSSAPQQFPQSPPNYREPKPIQVNHYEQLVEYLKSVTIKPNNAESQRQLHEKSLRQPIPQPKPQYIEQNPSVIQYYEKPKQVGILDQLAKDYALPESNSAPYHDISFGLY